MKIRGLFAAFSTAALLSLSGLQNIAMAAGIQIENAYAREMPPQAPASAAFMQISNHNASAVKLIGAESDAAELVELHTHSNDNGVMRMRKVSDINIPSHGTVSLQPGGFHIMLINPKTAFKAGNHINLTLKFSNGEKQSMQVPIKSMQAMMNNQNHHDHDHSMEHHHH